MSEDQRAASPSIPRKLPGWCRELLGLSVGIAVLLVGRASLADHYVVPSGSMEPTVMTGDRVLVNKAAFGWRLPFSNIWLGSIELPERGDVVILEPPAPEPVLLKRVVAHPGDRVEVRGGRIILNGQPVTVDREGEELVEHLGKVHHVNLAWGGGPDFGPATVPEGMLLVLGDNRGNSRDGRSFGFVPVETLRGRVLGAYARGGTLGWWDL